MLLIRNKYHSLSDNELAELYRQKQPSQVLGEIYKRYGHLVMGAAMKYLKNVQEAEDLTMNLFEKLPQKLIQNEIKHFKSWLYMVTRNECLMLLRKTNRSVDIPELEVSEDHEEEKVEYSDELVENLSKAIDELKEPQLSCIKLFYLDQKSYTEISQLLKLDLKKVKSAIQNGKRNLKIKLEGSYEK